jgi:outer membrane protein OmpA-like peptidoglycan-associated protein
MRARDLLAAFVLTISVPHVTLADPPPAAEKKLEVTVDRSKVDLAGHKLEVKMSRVAAKVRLKVIGESGAILAENETEFPGAAAGTALLVSWSPASEEAVAKIEVWGHDADGFFAGVAIIPWKASVPHEDVKFDTDSDVIRKDQVDKLEASLDKIGDIVKKHGDLGKITLFVVGHTDTMGSAEHNLMLSRKRARAIAAWFKGRGLKIPIAYEGMGESALLVKTADEVDEPKNRRVDYILALEPPALAGDKSWKTP